MFTPFSAIVLSLLLSAPAFPANPQAPAAAPSPPARQASAASNSSTTRTETWPLDAAWGRNTNIAGRPTRFDSLAATISGASGASVSYVESANSLVISGTDAELASATKTLERLSAEVKELASKVDEDGEAKDETRGDGQVSLDFPGGTLADYLQLVAKAGEFDNFLIQDPARTKQVPMPPVKLRNVDLRTAVRLVGPVHIQSSYGPGGAFTLSDGTKVVVTVNWFGPAVNQQSDPEEDRRNVSRSVCAVAIENMESPSTQSTRAVFDLSAMKELPKEEVQRVLDAVTIAVELDGSSPTFRAKYHEGSQLLIVRGTPDELDLVRQVFRARVPGFQEDIGPKVPAAPTTPRAR